MEGKGGKALGVISDKINIVDLEYAVTKKELQTDHYYEALKVLT
jgi:hypothetical protein